MILLEAGGADSLPADPGPGTGQACRGSAVDWQYKTVPQPQTLDRVHALGARQRCSAARATSTRWRTIAPPSCYDRGGAVRRARLVVPPNCCRTSSGSRASLGASDYHGGDGPIYVDVPRGSCSAQRRRPSSPQASRPAGSRPTTSTARRWKGPPGITVALRGRPAESGAVLPAAGARGSASAGGADGRACDAAALRRQRCVGVDYVNRRTPPPAVRAGASRRCARTPRGAAVHRLDRVAEAADALGPRRTAGTRNATASRCAWRCWAWARTFRTTCSAPATSTGLAAAAAVELPASQACTTCAPMPLPGPDLLLMFVTVPFASFTLPPPPNPTPTILPCIMQPQSAARSTAVSGPAGGTADRRYFTARGPRDDDARLRGRARSAARRRSRLRLRRAYRWARWNEPRSRDEFVRNAVNTFIPSAPARWASGHKRWSTNAAGAAASRACG